jgi:DNA (cytosine-5)-methyltransferase 1
VDSQQSPLRELALFAGAGGSILAGRNLGWRTVCAVEFDRYRQAVLVARQNDGSLDPFPIWDDVRTFDGRPWHGLVDIISGGFPCQDISAAGGGAGIDGARSGLWSEMARIVDEVRPGFVFVENSPMLVSRGLTRVLSDLASLGYDATWGVLGASDVGAWHRRERIWILAANAYALRELQSQGSERTKRGRIAHCAAHFSDAHEIRREARWRTKTSRAQRGAKSIRGHRGQSWAAEPNVVRMVHGLANGLDRVEALGDGWVPQCGAEAFLRLSERFAQ